MAERKPYFPPQNNGALNRAAWRQLKEAKINPQLHHLYLLQLAAWGLENGAQGEWPEQERAFLKDQVDSLFGWTKPESVIAWLLSNPEGPEKSEQQENLLQLLQTADSPQEAAAHVLNAIYSRQVSENPALQPAASELS